MAKRDNYLCTISQPSPMKQTRLLAIIFLLFLLLVAQRAVVAWPFTAEQYKEVRPADNDRPISLSASNSGGGAYAR